MLPSLDEVLVRYKNACELRSPTDPDRMIASMTQWLRGFIDVPFTVRIAPDGQDFFKAELDSWDEADDAPRYGGDLEVVTRPLRRTSAAMEAQKIRDGCAEWLSGDWPRAIWDAAWWCITAIGTIETGDVELYRKWESLLAAFEAGVWLFCITSTNELVLAPIPSKVLLDAESRLHCETGPAFVWLDYQEFHWHGVGIPASIILHPETITMEQIDNEQNPGLRQFMLQRYQAQHGTTQADS